MAKVPLIGGFYVAQSLLANAQRCLNLYPERNSEDAPFPFTTYLTPGLTARVQLDGGGMVRGLYRASTGDLYAVINQDTTNAGVYWVGSSWQLHLLGTIPYGTNPVSMWDNRLVVVLVDGSKNGWYIDLTNNRAFGSIVATAFYGADKVDYLDTYFIFNQPGTPNFYISAAEVSAQLLTGGGVLTGTIYGGTGYSNGVHGSVALTGGASGTGAIADITVSGNVVTALTITNGGGPYFVGDVLSASPTDLGGGITGQSIVGGVNYTPGTYSNVGLVGGTGSGAAATVVVTGSVVSAATITNQGFGYTPKDILTASSSALGGNGTGFQVVVSSVNTAGTGFTYTLTSVDVGSLAFNPLNIAAKSGGSDGLQTFVSIHRELWLLGNLTSEVWYDAGTPDFAFGELPGVFLEHGTVAKYSLAKADLNCFWLGQDLQGDPIVFMGEQYTARRISTHAIESAIQKYNVVSDAIGFTYQQNGHVFYQLTFPHADRTWVFDLATQMWHERAWIDNSGIEHRHRANCAAYAYGTNVVGDWQNGTLYAYDLSNQTDAGQPIKRVRGFPHLINDGKRVSYDLFIAEMAVGQSVGTTDDDLLVLAAPGGSSVAGNITTGQSILALDNTGYAPPSVSLRYSFTKGASWGNPVQISAGATGDFNVSMQRRQLGMGRDCVFELSWSGAFVTALNGAYIETSPAET